MKSTYEIKGGERATEDEEAGLGEVGHHFGSWRDEARRQQCHRATGLGCLKPLGKCEQRIEFASDSVSG